MQIENDSTWNPYKKFEDEIAELKRQLEDLSSDALVRANRIIRQKRKIVDMRQQLAESQARETRLRDALENHSGNYKLSKTECAVMNELLDQQHDDTELKEYLDAVIEEFVGKFKRHVGGDGEFWMHELEDFYQNTKAP